MSPFFTFLRSAMRLRRNARLSREQFETERLQRFRQLVRHAYRHSPYYARLIKAQEIDLNSCQPKDFPILTKRLLRDNFDDIVTDRRLTLIGIENFLKTSKNPKNRFLDEFIVLHTSGSSGEVGLFVFSEHDWMRGYANLTRATPPQWKRRRIAFFGATGGHFAAVSWVSNASFGLGRLFFDVVTFDMNAPFSETVARLNAFQPHILSGYPSGNKLLAGAQLDGRLKIQLEGIQCGGESLSTGDQSWLGKVFDCPSLNMYGATESMLMGLAREGDPGLTLFDDDLIIEPDAEQLLITNLFNYSLPLIRYQIGDTLHFTNKQGPYGHYPVVEPVVGRSALMAMFKNPRGETDFIGQSVIGEIFIPGITCFQLRRIDETSFRIAACMDSQAPEAKRTIALATLEKKLQEILEQKDLANVKFGVDVVDDILIDPITHKFKLIIQVE